MKIGPIILKVPFLFMDKPILGTMDKINHPTTEAVFLMNVNAYLYMAILIGINSKAM